MKKSRIIALFTAAVMIMSVIPAAAAGYFVDEEGFVYDKSGENLISNPGFEDGLTGLTTNEEYYEVSSEAAHSGTMSLKAIKSTKGDGAILKTYAVGNANASYYLSFWYKNVDTVARRPRVTFAFADSSGEIIESLVDETNGWVQAGTASNDQDMVYSKGDWVQYSTVLHGNGSGVIKNVVLEIYGLTKDVTYVDDFELYELIPSNEFSSTFQKAIEEWEKYTIPKGNLEGFGTLELPREVDVDGIGVKWMSSSDTIDAETGAYSAQPEEELVILTARLYAEDNEEVYYEYEYPYIVKSMFTPYIEWLKNEVFVELGSAIDSDVSLVKNHTIEGYYPATFTWECSESGVLDGDGNFTPPETTKSINLVVTIECNGATTSLTKHMKAIGGNIVNDGLIMYYDFEKSLGKGNVLYDNSQKAKAYNATVDGVTLVDGYAKFTGKSTIILPSDYATPLTGSYSVSMWVNVDKSIATNSGMYRFFDFGGGTMSSQFLRYIPISGEFAFMDRSTAPNKDTFALKKTTSDIFAQTWKLLTFVYDFSNTPAVAKLYIDGVEFATSSGDTLKNSVSSLVGSNSTTGFIGRTQWNDGDNPDFSGLMDDVRIYDRAITATEITTLYNETRPTVTAPVTIKFQDTDGETLKDDIIVSADIDKTFEVPATYKSLPSISDDQYRYEYKYVYSKSEDSITVSSDRDNVCILVFQLEKMAKGVNLLANGSFEENLDGWTYNNNGSFGPLQGWARSTDEVKDGSYSLKKTVTSGNGGTTNNNIGTYIPIEPGKKYTLSWWEYSSADKAPGSHQMMAAVVTSDNTSALGTTANRIVECGGWDSWNNNAMGQASRDPAYTTGWTQRIFELDTTNTPNAAYILIAYANGDASSVNYLDGFVLEEAGAKPDDGNTIDITVKYEDTKGNKIREDEIIKVAQGINDYTVPESYKVVEGGTQGSLIYEYKYNEDESRDVVSVSILKDNVATLVFDLLKFDVNGKSIMENGSFEDEEGNFSLETWLSCQTNQTFGSPYSTNHGYAIAADKHIGDNGQEYTSTNIIPDGNWAFGSKWNDGTNGLCSLANFVPVKGGVSYLVSYDYKHKTAGTDGKYISTSFVTSKSISAGESEGANIPKNVTTEWQTNTFIITAPRDGYIYFHFSHIGSGNGPGGGNDGSGPFWYFDNFKVIEQITFENNITYSAGYAEILAEDGTEGYLVQATYDNEGALTNVVISDKLTLNKETATKVPVAAGAKLMLVKDLVSLEPLAPAIIAE